jgi:hypothetical protein
MSDDGLEIARRYVAELDDRVDGDALDKGDVNRVTRACVAIAAERDAAREQRHAANLERANYEGQRDGARDNLKVRSRELRAMESERDAYRAMVADLLASAYPHPIEHPTMTKQWARARELLKNGPNDTKPDLAALAKAANVCVSEIQEVFTDEALRDAGVRGLISAKISAAFIDGAFYAMGLRTGRLPHDPPVGCFRCGVTNEASPLASETPAGVRYVCKACVKPDDRLEVGDTLTVAYVGVAKEPTP